MKKLIGKIIMILAVASLMIPVFCLSSCKVDFWEDSEIYTCYYYAADGKDLTDEIISYTLELRSDNNLITRYKTKKNSDSGKDEYYIEGNTLVIATTSPNKRYDISANEIIISDYIDKTIYVLAKFRLTKTAKEFDKTVYSCISKAKGETDLMNNYKYQLVCFEESGEFSMFSRTSERQIIRGTFTSSDEGYHAIENTNEDSESVAREWFFEITEQGLCLEEAESDGTVISQFLMSEPPQSNN